MFLKISQNPQENNCAIASFLIKLQASASNLIKKETLPWVFSCEFCKISKNTFFTEHVRATASVRIIWGYFVYSMIASECELWSWQLINFILGNIGTPAIEPFQLYIFSQNINNMNYNSWLLTGFDIKWNMT